MKICDVYGKFCNRAGEGVACALLMSLSFVVLASISAFSLFRLYGSNKSGKQGSMW
uniref:CASP-like protein n=1 Tax=Kalanchoe fedtschenkoi TaxID=63787 RepID=A0A7N0VM01_KALFE